FCLLNDFAVAANYVLNKGLARQVLIIDLDVHQGNGTAAIFSSRPNVFTFSMHGRHNYPFHKETSDLDLPLEDGLDDTTYLSLLAEALQQLDKLVQPDFVFYLSGVDILETDKFGKLKVSVPGCRQRDEMVFKWVRAKNIPCVVAMGGGYSADVKIITEAHCNTFRSAKSVFELW
ncbi:MAG: histone deacetylase, partial [Pedobacter sp.]